MSASTVVVAPEFVEAPAAVPPEWEVAEENSSPEAEAPVSPEDPADRCVLCGYLGRDACLTMRAIHAMSGGNVQVLSIRL